MPKKIAKGNLWNIWTKTIAVIMAIGAIVSGVMFTLNEFDTKFARADEVKQTKMLLADSLKQVNQSIQKTNVRIDYHQLMDRATYIKRQMQEIRNICKTNNAYEMPASERKRYNDYQIQLDQIDVEMKSLSGKQ